MYNEIIEDRMTIFLEDDLIAPNVKCFNTSVSEYLLDLDVLDEVVLNLNNPDFSEIDKIRSKLII